LMDRQGNYVVAFMLAIFNHIVQFEKLSKL
jgi:hypothetical protein